MKILMLGDTHGNIAWVRHAISEAVESGCDRIFQLGDFGFWPHTAAGQLFLREVDKACLDAAIPLYWLDGNHENHDMLNAELERRGNKHDDFLLVGDAVIYCPRGFRWEWDGVSFLSMGGAFSIDKHRRVLGASWWPGELITQQDIHRANNQEPVDVILAHDAPLGVNPLPPGTRDIYPQSINNRTMLSIVVNFHQPQLVLHGHYHHAYEREANIGKGLTTLVRGLSCENRKGSMCVLDTNDIRDHKLLATKK